MSLANPTRRLKTGNFRAQAPGKPHVLVVVDEEVLRRSLATTREQEGYEVRGRVCRYPVRGGGPAVPARSRRPRRAAPWPGRLHARPPPAADERHAADLPQCRRAEEDRLRGFAAGGDDYLVKPLVVGELLARITVLLRRSGRSRCEATPTTPTWSRRRSARCGASSTPKARQSPTRSAPWVTDSARDRRSNR